MERCLVACDMHVSGMHCMSSTYMSVCDIHSNDMVLLAHDMLQQHWTYLCGCPEVRVHAACCPVLPPSGLPHHFLLSRTLPSFATSQKRGDFNFCSFDWIQVELLPKEESTVIFVWAEIFLSLLRDACNHHPHQIAA